MINVLLQGMLFCTNECLTTPGRFVRLWMHEATRVYCDKLVDHKDQDTFQKLMTENVKKVFAVSPYTTYLLCFKNVWSNSKLLVESSIVSMKSNT